MIAVVAAIILSPGAIFAARRVMMAVVLRSSAAWTHVRRSWHR